MYHLDDRVTPTGLVANQPDPVLLWHWHLSHPSVQKLGFVVPIKFFVSSSACESCELVSIIVLPFIIESIIAVALRLS